jgi:hypothetical protein
VAGIVDAGAILFDLDLTLSICATLRRFSST